MPSCFKKTAHVVEREIRGEHILVPIMRNMETLDSIYTLNETAGCIWRNAVSGMTEDRIATLLAEEFDVDPATAQADTRRILNDLIEIKALQPVTD